MPDHMNLEPEKWIDHPSLKDIPRSKLEFLQIMVFESDITTYGWYNGELFGGAWERIGVMYMGSGIREKYRMYMNMSFPDIPGNTRIKKAEITFTQYYETYEGAEVPKIGLYEGPESLENVAESNYNPVLIDCEVVKAQSDYQNYVTYTFDVTKLLDEMVRREKTNINLLIKLVDEEVNLSRDICIFSRLSLLIKV